MKNQKRVENRGGSASEQQKDRPRGTARTQSGQLASQQPVGPRRAGQPRTIDAPSDLKRNPGIGASKGAFASGQDPEILEGVNTYEGDVENETSRYGGVNIRRRRTNK